jgi:Ca2+-binding EF-hand superfamily protein
MDKKVIDEPAVKDDQVEPGGIAENKTSMKSAEQQGGTKIMENKDMQKAQEKPRRDSVVKEKEGTNPIRVDTLNGRNDAESVPGKKAPIKVKKGNSVVLSMLERAQLKSPRDRKHEKTQEDTNVQPSVRDQLNIVVSNDINQKTKEQNITNPDNDESHVSQGEQLTPSGGYAMSPRAKLRAKDTRPTQVRARELFDVIDEDGSGTLSKDEVAKLMEQMGSRITSMMGGTKKLDEAFAEMDPNADGTVTFDEFLVWYKRSHPETLEDMNAQVRFYFDLFDEDGSGTLDKAEVGKVMSKLGIKKGGVFFGRNKKLDNAFAEMDPNGDGSVTYEEFLDWYHGHVSKMDKKVIDEPAVKDDQVKTGNSVVLSMLERAQLKSPRDRRHKIGPKTEKKQEAKRDGKVIEVAKKDNEIEGEDEEMVKVEAKEAGTKHQ